MPLTPHDAEGESARRLEAGIHQILGTEIETVVLGSTAVELAPDGSNPRAFHMNVTWSGATRATTQQSDAIRALLANHPKEN